MCIHEYRRATVEIGERIVLFISYSRGLHLSTLKCGSDHQTDSFWRYGICGIDEIQDQLSQAKIDECSMLITEKCNDQKLSGRVPLDS